ncbi:hypothetical protein pb186bvf_005483 [Paramecium bursaria]
MNQGVVYLARVEPKKTFIFNGENLKPTDKLYSIQSYRYPLQGFSVLCPPARDLQELENGQGFPFDSAFIKVQPKDECNYIEGKASGKRSAIYENYRFKGCGNLDLGFNVQIMPHEIGEYFREIRGCQFEHTAKRELYVTHRVDQILHQYGLEGANKSLGYWEYNDVTTINDQLAKKLENEGDFIPKYCSIFQTLGDSRLGTHLLQGLKRLLQPLVNAISLDELKQKIDIPERIKQFEFEKPTNEWHLTGTYFLQRDIDFIINQPIPLKEQAEKDLIFDWALEKHSNIQFDGDLKIFGIIYERLGYEVGRIKRIFIDHDLNWGYFRDHSKLMYHTNAHLDNFVVVTDREYLLAPLDFDIAFFKEEFVNMEIDFNYYFNNIKIIDMVRNHKDIDLSKLNLQPEQVNQMFGKFDEKLWNWGLEMERYVIELAISGADVIQGSNMFIDEVQSKQTEIFEVIYHDRMRIGYLNGFNHRQDTSNFQQRQLI